MTVCIIMQPVADGSQRNWRNCDYLPLTEALNEDGSVYKMLCYCRGTAQWTSQYTDLATKSYQTSISANADGPHDAALRKIDHIALPTEYNYQATSDDDSKLYTD